MADITNIISGLLIEEATALAEELKTLDKKIYKKIQKLIDSANLTFKEALEYVINDSIVLWAKVHLNWEARGYQKTILSQSKISKKLVLRLGRRLGKTECMVISILWHAFRQPNKREVDSANAYEILILTPADDQIDLIFDRMKQLIDSSPTVSSMVSRSIHHRYEFINGTIIKGRTTGSTSGNGAVSTRGQAASLLVLDEVDKVSILNFISYCVVYNDYMTTIMRRFNIWKKIELLFIQ